jgi:hypothetical protein
MVITVALLITRYNDKPIIDRNVLRVVLITFFALFVGSIFYFFTQKRKNK